MFLILFKMLYEPSGRFSYRLKCYMTNPQGALVRLLKAISFKMLYDDATNFVLTKLYDVKFVYYCTFHIFALTKTFNK